MKPALLFYCQHSVGLGHLMRSYALCDGARRALPRRAARAAASCPTGIEPPRGVELVALPPLGVQRTGVRQRRPALHDRARVGGAHARASMTHAATSVAPSVVLVELFPFGRAKFARELIPLLEQARALGAFTACSLRDILVSTRENQREHDDRAARARRRAPGRRARPLRPALRPPGGDLQADARRSPSPSTTRASSPAATAAAARARRAHRRLRRRRARRQRRCSNEAMARRRDGRPMRAIAGPLMPDEDYARAAATRAAQRRAPALGPRPRRRAQPRRRRASASAATTPRSTCSARASPRSSSPTRRPRRTSRPAARAGSSSSASLKVATHINGDLDALLRLHARARRARPRRRAPATARSWRVSPDAVLRPYILAPVARAARRRPRRPLVLAARRAGQAVADRADRRPPASATARRRSTLDTGASLLAIGALILAIAVAESAAHVLQRPVDAERRRAHHPRAARRGLRPPAAAQPRLPPAHATRATCSRA